MVLSLIICLLNFFLPGLKFVFRYQKANKMSVKYDLVSITKEAEHDTLGLCVFILLMQPTGPVFSC